MWNPRKAVVIQYFLDGLVKILSPSHFGMRFILIEGGGADTWLGTDRCFRFTTTRETAQAPSHLAGKLRQPLLTLLQKRVGRNLPLKIVDSDNWKRGLRQSHFRLILGFEVASTKAFQCGVTVIRGN